MNNRTFRLWAEKYFFNPTLFDKFISFLLLPFSFIYCVAVYLKRTFTVPISFGIPIISVGNRILGGSGKTPIILKLSRMHKKPAIILRGYKRNSHGLLIVSDFGKILTSVQESGDEAMLYALSSHALVIVSNNRDQAILKAKNKGAKVVFLDDAFSKAHIDKFDILIEPNKTFNNHFCLPSGPYREGKYAQKYADLIIQEGKDFKRITTIFKPTDKMVLVTSIANASRLDPYLPQNLTCKEIFPDHYHFKKEELLAIIRKTNATSLLVTRKDWVKIRHFNLPLSFLELDIDISEHIIKKIYNYIKSFS